MSEPTTMLISQGFMWRCLACGENDGTFIDREHCEAAAIRHHNECEAA